MAPGYYDGTRRKDDLHDKGISAHEREHGNPGAGDSQTMEFLGEWAVQAC